MASSSSQLGASSSVPRPSSSSFRLIHDVFLSFSGKDTRHNFTSHLYAALIQNGIYAYLDDSELERGKAIEQSLWKAIEESKFSIVVFSKGYASSTWCLDELVKIVECMNEMGQIVFPIFYEVDPSDVAEQKGDYYSGAFMKHEQDFWENPEKVQRWRDAVTQVANLSGWDTRNRNESKIIGEIIDKILENLSPAFSSISKYLVGMHSRVREVLDLLGAGVNDVRMIGIHGMGGIGKTTIARVVYDRICRQFEGSCFIADVKEVFGKYGPRPMQEQLLSEILRQPNAKIWDFGRGISEIQRRLRHKKVLIVIDDMSELKQLEMLAIENSTFGLGSRIIITTRDKHLLDAHGVDGMYEVQQLNDEDSIRLFSQKAFKNDKPTEGYYNLSKCVVRYCQGLPLALEVLGSFLCGRNANIWKSAIRGLKKTPHNEIVSVLQISFNGLNELEKKIFLDIACFFKGMTMDKVTRILDYFGFEAVIGIEVLIDKSLISTMHGVLWMHDLLQNMGREIVHQESPDEPGGCSRLWEYGDVFHVLAKNTGGKEVEGIALDLPKGTELKIPNLNVEAFSKMSRLRLLIIPNLHLVEGALYDFNNLRFLKLHYCSSKSLPSSFQLEYLFELDMSFSSVKQLWHGRKTLGHLRIINLSHCRKLIKTPDFSGTLNLERLIFEGCTSLFDIHPSIGHLTKLIHVNLVGCSKVNKFPGGLKNIICLQELLLDGTGIERVPISNQHLNGLFELSLKNCKYLKSLPSSIDGLKSLEKLDVSGCSKLKKFPDIVGNMECLLELHLDGTGIGELLPSVFQRLPGLVELSLKNCKIFRSLPSSINGLKSLERLDVSGCSRLVENISSGSVGRKIANPSTPVLSSLSGLHSLDMLDLSMCNLGEGDIPNDLDFLASLRHLDLSNNNFVSLPTSISQLSKLEILRLENCKMLQSLPDLPSKLEYISVTSCSSLEKMSPIKSNKSLAISFNAENCFKLCDDNDGGGTTFTILKMFLQDAISSKTEEIDMVVPGSEIPEWFTCESKGNSVEIPSLGCLNGHNNGEWIGIAACVVLSPSSKQNEHVLNWVYCHYKEVGDDFISNLNQFGFRGLGSDHLWLFYLSRESLGSDKATYEPLSSNKKGIEAMKCGFRPVHYKDLEEWSGITSQRESSSASLMDSRYPFGKLEFGF